MKAFTNFFVHFSHSYFQDVRIQVRQCTCNVTVRRVHATSVAVEKQWV